MLFSVIPDYDSRPIMICNVWLPVSIYIFSLSLALSLSPLSCCRAEKHRTLSELKCKC